MEMCGCTHLDPSRAAPPPSRKAAPSATSPPRLIIRICAHRLANGRRCRGAALRGYRFCRHHLDCKARQHRKARALRQLRHIRLPLLLDLHAALEGQARVRSALAAGYITRRDAGLLTQALRLVASNFRWMDRMEAERFALEQEQRARPKAQAKFNSLYQIRASP